MLGTYIRTIRLNAGYSPEQFSSANHISLKELINIEHGRVLPSKWKLLQMAEVFSLNAFSLFVKHHAEMLYKATSKSTGSFQRKELMARELKGWNQKEVIIQPIPVYKPLSDYIESIIYYEEANQLYASELVAPDGMPRLVIDLITCQATFIGQRDKPLYVPLEKDLRQLIVRFRPHGLYAMTGIPQEHLLNTMLDAARIFGNTINVLSSGLAECLNADSIINFFSRLLPTAEMHPVEQQVIRFVVQHIDHPIRELAAKAGYTHKHLIHLFRQHVGLTPKILQQLVLFNASLHEISLLPSPHLSAYNWSSAYFDQAHFTRQFLRFSGLTPTAYLKTGNTCPRMIRV